MKYQIVSILLLLACINLCLCDGAISLTAPKVNYIKEIKT